MNADSKIKVLINGLADRAESAGIAVDGEPGGTVHRFAVSQGCPRDKMFFVVFLLTAELADREARREGFRDQYHRAAVWASEKRHSRKRRS